MDAAVVLLAGGSGSRVRRDVNKVFLSVAERDLLAYSLDTLERSEAVDMVVLVVREEDRARAAETLRLVGASKVVAVVDGGPTRHRSEHAGLAELAPAIEQGRIELVALHDAARPFMTVRLLEDVLAEARRTGGAVPGVAPAEQLFLLEDGVAVPLRSDTLRKVQTPQAFRAAPLLAAYRRAEQEGFEGVDTAETVERFSSLAVGVVPGDPRNIKVTYVEDLFQAEELATGWESGRWSS